jgi:hypothetical protein
VPDLSEWLSERKLLHKLIQQQLLRAQQQMKHQADNKRSEREFQVGDMVYLKLQPHIQSSVAFRSNHKLSFRFFGPFKVLAKVGAVAYRRELLASAQIHPVVHVSQLKKRVPPHTEVQESLDTVATDHDVSVLPIQVLAVRDILVGSKMKQQLLVQWDGHPTSSASREDAADMKRHYPTAWGQAVAKGGGNVMKLIRPLRISQRG